MFMLQHRNDALALSSLVWRKVRSRTRRNCATTEDVERTLKLRGEVQLKKPARSLRGGLQGAPKAAVDRSHVGYRSTIFLPAPMSFAHTSRIPVNAASSCSSVSIPPLK